MLEIPNFFIEQKKGKKVFEGFVYWRFLSTSIVTMLKMATNMNSPAIAGMKYASVGDCMGIAVGSGVAAGVSTTNELTACDGQYDSLPPNDA